MILIIMNCLTLWRQLNEHFLTQSFSFPRKILSVPKQPKNGNCKVHRNWVAWLDALTRQKSTEINEQSFLLVLLKCSLRNGFCPSFPLFYCTLVESQQSARRTTMIHDCTTIIQLGKSEFVWLGNPKSALNWKFNFSLPFCFQPLSNWNSLSRKIEGWIALRGDSCGTKRHTSSSTESCSTKCNVETTFSSGNCRKVEGSWRQAFGKETLRVVYK